MEEESFSLKKVKFSGSAIHMEESKKRKRGDKSIPSYYNLPVFAVYSGRQKGGMWKEKVEKVSFRAETTFLG